MQLEFDFDLVDDLKIIGEVDIFVKMVLMVSEVVKKGNGKEEMLNHTITITTTPNINYQHQ